MNTPENNKTEDVILDGKIFALLSYLWVLCIIPLVFKRNNEFALFHGKQGLVIFVGEVAIFIIQIILGGWFLRLGIFLFGLFSLIGIIAVLNGKYLKLPIVADIAEKITL